MLLKAIIDTQILNLSYKIKISKNTTCILKPLYSIFLSFRL